MRASIPLIAALLAFTSVHAVREPVPEPRCVVGAHAEGIVGTAMAEYVDDAVEAAEEGPCEAVLLTLDTPGGSVSATRHITQTLLNAEVPVIAYVSPSGARAGSAGMFVVMAAHYAAMAPGTHIGAAHPVIGLGDPEPVDEHVARKVENDTAAMARAIARERSRNAAWAERAVRESVSATAHEAADLDVVDSVANSAPALLAAIHGTTVRLPSGDHALRTDGAQIRPLERTLQQRVLMFLNDPNVAYLLFTLGIVGLVIEIYSPGLVLPGALGVIAIVLGAIGLEMLPVRPAAIVLLGAAGLLLVMELFVASGGLLALVGLTALVAGSVLLIDRSAPGFFADPSVEVSPGVIVPLVVAASAGALALAWLVARSNRRRSTTGAEGLLGKTAEAMTEVGPSGGKIRLDGERWNAVSKQSLQPGQRARVIGIHGLTLEVTPRPPTSRQGDAP